MKKRILIKQLKSLRSLEPRAAWKSEARLVLRQQIGLDVTRTASDRVSVSARAADYLDFVGFNAFRLIRRLVMQPVGVGALVLVVILSSGSFAVNASLDSLPGDTFYSLKRTAEKMQMVLTRDQARKAKLSLEFANRRLEEISEIQAKPTVNAVSKQAKVNQAIQTFQLQMEDVKAQIKQLEESTKTEPPVKKDAVNNAVEIIKPIQEHLLYTERKLIEVVEQKKKDEAQAILKATVKIEESEELSAQTAADAGDESVAAVNDLETTVEPVDPLQSAKQALVEVKNNLAKKDLNAALETINNSQSIVNTALTTELVNEVVGATAERASVDEQVEDEVDEFAEDAAKEETAVEDETAAGEAL